MKIFTDPFGIKKRRNERYEKLGQEYLQAYEAQQREYGQRAFMALQEAARQNNVSNVHPDGSVATATEKITVSALPENGPFYTICIGMPSRDSGSYDLPGISGFRVVQLDINMKNPGKEIHTHTGICNGDNYYSLELFNGVIGKLAREVETYEHFR